MFSDSVANADTLNFLEWEEAGVPKYSTGETELSLSNATVKTTGPQIYYAGAGGWSGDKGLGTVGACDVYGYCSYDLEIAFKQPIFNLSFDAVAVGLKDIVKISAYNGATNVGEVTLQNSNNSKGFYFSKFGTITRLVFDDLGSENAGVLYNDFYFETASVSAVPLPAALPLYGAGMAVLGFMGWRRKKTSA